MHNPCSECSDGVVNQPMIQKLVQAAAGKQGHNSGVAFRGGPVDNLGLFGEEIFGSLVQQKCH